MGNGQQPEQDEPGYVAMQTDSNVSSLSASSRYRTSRVRRRNCKPTLLESRVTNWLDDRLRTIHGGFSEGEIHFGQLSDSSTCWLVLSWICSALYVRFYSCLVSFNLEIYVSWNSYFVFCIILDYVSWKFYLYHYCNLFYLHYYSFVNANSQTLVDARILNLANSSFVGTDIVFIVYLDLSRQTQSVHCYCYDNITLWLFIYKRIRGDCSFKFHNSFRENRIWIFYLACVNWLIVIIYIHTWWAFKFSLKWNFFYEKI